jgi:hypothetical protein
MIRRNTPLLLLIFLAFPGLNAQYIEVLAELDTNQVRIGEVFHLDLRVEQPVGLQVVFPPIGDTLIDKVEVLEEYPLDTLSSENEILKIEKRYQLTCFDSGLYEIPPLAFQFAASDWSDTISTYPIYLLVNTLAVDSSYYDIKSPIHVPVGFMEIFPYAAGGAMLLGLLIVLIWYLRKRRRGEAVFHLEKPREPAHVIALRELDALSGMKLWQQGEFKPYYTELTGIIRRYMERRYGIMAMEMTSYDILQAWKRSGEDNEGLAPNLDRLLNLADLVKFAREKPLASDNEENLERAYDFVHRTKLVKPLFGEEENAETHGTDGEILENAGDGPVKEDKKAIENE